MADDAPVDPASLEPHDAAAALDTAIAEAETAKTEGNGKLKLGTKSGYLEAKEFYSKGIQLLESAATQVHSEKGSLSDEARAKGGQMLSILFGNRSHTKLMLRDFPGSVDDARRAFGIDPYNIKAYWRAAKASLGLQLYKNAKEFCDAGLALQPGHPDLEKLAELCTAKLEGQREARQKRDGEWSADEASQIQQNAADLNARLQLTTAQLEESKREIIRTGIIQKAIQDLAPDRSLFRKVGRCFVLGKKEEMSSELAEHARKLEEETAPRLSAQRVELEARAKEAEEELRAMVSSFQRQQAVAA
jgi:chaperonin cofactor prefoldin